MQIEPERFHVRRTTAVAWHLIEANFKVVPRGVALLIVCSKYLVRNANCLVYIIKDVHHFTTSSALIYIDILILEPELNAKGTGGV